MVSTVGLLMVNTGKLGALEKGGHGSVIKSCAEIYSVCGGQCGVGEAVGVPRFATSNTSARIDRGLPGKHPHAELPCTTAEPNGLIEQSDRFQRWVFFDPGKFSNLIYASCRIMPQHWLSVTE